MLDTSVKDVEQRNSNHTTFQIQCDACNNWVIPNEDDCDLSPETAAVLERYYCLKCRQARLGLRKRKRIDFVKLHNASLLDDESVALGIAAGDVQEIDYRSILQQRQRRGIFKAGTGNNGCIVQLPKTKDFDATYASVHGFNHPVLISNKKPCDIGLQVPPNDFTFSDVARLVGKHRVIPVIDARTQLTTEYTLK